MDIDAHRQLVNSNKITARFTCLPCRTTIHSLKIMCMHKHFLPVFLVVQSSTALKLCARRAKNFLPEGSADIIYQG